MHTTIDLSDYEVLVSWHGYVKFYDNMLLQTKALSTQGEVTIVLRIDKPVASYTIEEATDSKFKYDLEQDTLYHDLLSFDTPEFWIQLADILRKFIDDNEHEWPQSCVTSFDPLSDLLGTDGVHSGPTRYYDKEGNPIDLAKLGLTA